MNTKCWIFLVYLFSGSLSAHSLLSNMNECAALVTDDERLSCYDSLYTEHFVNDTKVERAVTDTKKQQETVDINGHVVQYIKTAGLEYVTINGKDTKFFMVGKKYQIEQAAYLEPRDTLLEAVIEYVKTLPDAK